MKKLTWPSQINDTTITAVTCLAACEAFRGNARQLQVHMNGVQKMVEMRGNLTKLGMRGLLQSEHVPDLPDIQLLTLPGQ